MSQYRYNFSINLLLETKGIITDRNAIVCMTAKIVDKKLLYILYVYKKYKSYEFLSYFKFIQKYN